MDAHRWRQEIGTFGAVGGPGEGSAPVTPNDSADLTEIARSLYVTGAGDVKFDGADGTTDTWTVPANFVIPVAVRRVYATGTTATGIKAIW
jgi:hypothetical protein